MNSKRVISTTLLFSLLIAVLVSLLGKASAQPVANYSLPKPYRVKNIDLQRSANPRHLIAQAQGIYFSAQSGGVSGLWRSDGTEAGTVLVKSFGSNSIEEPIAYTPWVMAGDKLYLITVIPGALWRSDGTGVGTVMLSGPPECDYPELVTAVGDNVYYFAGLSGDWLCQAGEPGVLIKNIEARIRDAIAGDTLLFFHTESGKIGVSDGTPAGTKIYTTPYVITGPMFTLAVIGDALYFNGCVSTSDCELWKLDGLSGPPQRVKDIEPGPAGSNPTNLIVMNNHVYFTVETYAPGGNLRYLWKSDGTETGTVPFADVASGVSAAVVGHRLYFSGYTEESGYELWVTDGTTEGTALVKDIVPGPNHAIPVYLTAARKYLFFSADDGVHGQELWVTDGTEEGTIMVSDPSPQVGEPGESCPYGSCPSLLTFSEKKLYFSSHDQQDDNELWALLVDYEGPIADFTASPNRGKLPLKVDFENLSTGDFDTCSWDFGDGNVGTNCHNQTHTYNSPGTFSVTLTAAGPAGEDKTAKRGYIVVENYRSFMPTVWGE